MPAELGNFYKLSPLCIAPNNANAFGVTPQQKKACQDQWANSAAGKTAQFFSLYNLATNLKNVWKECERSVDFILFCFGLCGTLV